MKKILFCTNIPLVKELGGAKVVVELAEEMRQVGWQCDLVSPPDFGIAIDGPRHLVEQAFHGHLREHLLKHAEEYDVIDYDHEHLPFPRKEFSERPLFVARSVLLVHHLARIPIPAAPTLKGQVGALIKGPARFRRQQERICKAQAIVEQADLVNVSNSDDRNELARWGVDEQKVVVIPYGISRTRRPSFDRISSDPPAEPMVGFVGTFDYRKGAREFPTIVEAIADKVPRARFRLLGTKGLFRTKEEVLARFHKRIFDRIEVIPFFESDKLPELLAPCSVGMFPSYMEGMPFGVLEMLAASVPVIAYRCPGTPMLLTDEHLVRRGDAEALANGVASLLSDRVQLAESRIWAKRQSQQFSWERSANMTNDVYLSRLALRQ